MNGINRQADFGTKDNDETCKTIEINYKPWRQDGEHILICLQHDKSEQWKESTALDQYVRNTVLEIRKYTDRKIIVRSQSDVLIKFTRVG